jgi:dTDP-glucose pyrophosphorylase
MSGGMLNIVVPMAGRGSRFREAGYELPKPLIPIRGVPMIGVVIENIRPRREHRFVFVCQREHLDHYDVPELLCRLAPGCRIVPVSGITEGAACTVLLARELIDNDQPLMIANSDQYVTADIDDYLDEMDRQGADGLIMTMQADDPKWSFVRFAYDGSVQEVVEKQVVSNEATVGIYNYRRGRDFVSAADAMIQQDLRVNDEFYVAPAYNEMIRHGARIVARNIGGVGQGMYGLGTPADLERFLKLPIFHTLGASHGSMALD